MIMGIRIEWGKRLNVILIIRLCGIGCGGVGNRRMRGAVGCGIKD